MTLPQVPVGLKGHTFLALQDLLKPYSTDASLNATTCQKVRMFLQHHLWKLPLPMHTSIEQAVESRLNSEIQATSTPSM
jgi:hypothetical protein